MKITPSQAFLDILQSLNASSRQSLHEKYDKNVQGNTWWERGEAAAAVITPFVDFPELADDLAITAVAVGSGGDPVLAKANPHLAAQHSMLQAACQVSAVGGIWLGATDGLNCGNPENKKIMGELIAIIDGLQVAGEALQIPIVSGNVSLYNQTQYGSIPAMALVSVFGRVDNPRHVAPLRAKHPGNIWLISDIPVQQWNRNYSVFNQIYDLPSGPITPIDYPRFIQWSTNLSQSIHQQKLTSITPIAKGGISVALLRLVLGTDFGVTAHLNPRCNLANLLWSEPTGVIATGDDRYIKKIFSDQAQIIGNITTDQRYIAKVNQRTLWDFAIDKLARSYDAPLRALL